MKYLPVLCVFSLLAALAAPAAHAAAALEETARVIVRFKPTADSVRAKALALMADAATAQDVAQTRATALGLRTGLNTRLSQGLKAHLSLDSRTHVITASGINSAALVQRLALDSEVELAVVDQRRRHTLAPNDPFYATAAPNGPTVGQWYLKTASSVPGEAVSSINAPSAWDITTGSASIVVAVLDTGVRKDHPDLAAQFIGGYDMISNAATSGKGGLGRNSDASDPGDYVSQADIDGGTLGSGCDATDIGNSSWHGTRVSGLIAAAANNGLGMAGVAWGVKILPVRVLGKCGGFDSDIMDGMLWAAGITVAGLPVNPNPAKVLNLSLGGTGACGTTGTGALYRSVINQVIAKGATVVVAAGNSEGQAVGIPGNCPGVVTVTGLRHVGSKVGFSSVGPEVSIAAPGGNCVNLTGACLYPMFSTTNSGTTTPVLADNAYTNNNASVGTSFSTPIAAGTVALMLSVRPSMTSTEVTAMLKKTSRPFVTTGGTAAIPQCVAPSSTAVQDECYCTTSTCGAGMLDAGAAVTAAQAANATTAQTISFAAPASVTLATGTVALTGSASSGLSLSYSSSTASVCTVSGNTVTLRAAGTCTITANQAGNGTYLAATAVTSSFAVTTPGVLNAQNISFAVLATQTLGTPAPTLSASASSGLAISFASVTASVCSINGSSVTLLTAGTCTITASQAGNTTYSAATPVTRSFSVLPGSQTISFAGPAGQVLGATPLTLSASSSSGLAVSLTANTPAVCSLSGNTLTLLTAGTCTLTASQAGDANYSAAAAVVQSFAVAPTPQTISFAAPADQVIGVAAPALTATATSGLPVTFTATPPAVCTVNGSALTLLAAGTCTVTASQGGNANTAAATSVSRSFTVAAAPVVASSGGGGGGGGAFGGFWVLMLGVASYCLRRPRKPSALHGGTL